MPRPLPASFSLSALTLRAASPDAAVRAAARRPDWSARPVCEFMLCQEPAGVVLTLGDGDDATRDPRAFSLRLCRPCCQVAAGALTDVGRVVTVHVLRGLCPCCGAEKNARGNCPRLESALGWRAAGFACDCQTCTVYGGDCSRGALYDAALDEAAEHHRFGECLHGRPSYLKPLPG